MLLFLSIENLSKSKLELIFTFSLCGVHFCSFFLFFFFFLQQLVFVLFQWQTTTRPSHETRATSKETEEDVKKSMSGIIGVSGESSFSDVILCKQCLL